MPAKINDLQTELRSLKEQRAALHLEAIQRTYDDAAAAHAAQAAAEARSTSPDSRDLVDMRLAKGAALNVLNNAKTRAQSLDGQMEPLTAMLTGAARAATLQADADVLQGRLNQASEAVVLAQTTCTNLAGLLVEAHATHDAEREASARLLMQAAREGRALVVHPPERGHIASLEAAHTMAQAEFEDAHAAHVAVGVEHADVLARLNLSQRDSMRLALELKLRDFADFVVAYRHAHEWRYDPAAELADRIAHLESSAAAEQE